MAMQPYVAMKSTRHKSSTTCAVCLKLGCALSTHRDYVARQRDSRPHYPDPSALLSASFASSYAFNPLSVAIAYVCGEARLDIHGHGLNSETASLPSALHKLISYDIGRNVPFTDPAGHSLGSVAAEWLVATSVDELACTSTLNLWVMINWRLSKQRGLQQYSTHLTKFFLDRLRQRVESNEAISPGTIFAASNHLAICLIFFDQPNAQRKVLMDGLESLVNACGGFRQVAEATHPGVFQSLLWSDVLYSCYTGSKPRFQLIPPPPMPGSLASTFSTVSIAPAVYQAWCHPDLLVTAGYLRFFLLFRHGSEVRTLSREEYQYMVTLERFVHVQLLDQSAHYRYDDEDGSIDECVAIAMGLVRMSVLCVWEQHLRARKMYTQRLAGALARVSLNTWLETKAVHGLIWICWVMLAQSEPLAQSPRDLRPTIKLLSWGLKVILGEDISKWSSSWANGFADDLHPLLWHPDYDKYILMVSEMVTNDCT